MTEKTAVEDLLVLARRDRLADAEERRLELSLGASRELSLLYEAGVGFDAEASLLPGDQALTAQLVERTLQELDRNLRQSNTLPGEARRPARAGGRHSAARYFALSVACGALLSVAVASAWQHASARWFTPQSSAAVARSTPRRVRPLPVSPQATPPSLSPELPLPAESTKTALKNAAPRASAARAAPSTPSARELFTRGSEARRRGDVEAAVLLYEQLCAVHPDSVEAADARLVLGNLQLEQRAPRAALSQFENYGAGALSLEALWGKAQALRKLESSEERAVLELLVRDHPGSPYAAAAKKRLQQLVP